MQKMFYTNERNVQIVISLLKAHGIKKVIASPGTTNMTFVGSIQQDPWFEIYSSVDERSAAYMACGLAEETGQPVVISCTGATASRNYLSGLTEAYYRKLPVLAITSHRGVQHIGHLKDQQIDRRQHPNDTVRISVTVPLVKCAEDEDYCLIEASKAILSLFQRGGGPAHIDLYTSYSQDFSVKELPPLRIINRISSKDKLPVLQLGIRLGIFVGSHKTFTEEETSVIDSFCEAFNSLVICDKTSGYHGKYGVCYSLIGAQTLGEFPPATFDIIIHIGEVTGDTYGRFFDVKEVWRVSPDGEIRDFFCCLTNVFECDEISFFRSYIPTEFKKNTTLFSTFEEEYNRILKLVPELPFGNLWIANSIYNQLPSNCVLHLGIFNSLRSWNFFKLRKDIRSNCNVGGFGIDGGLSSMIGASLADLDKLYFGVFGDLAFFYDMNCLGNRHVGNNIRLLLINNGKGNEFRLSMHPCNIFGEDADKFMAAAGHYGNKSSELVKHYALDLGFDYLTASNKEDFLKALPIFLNPSVGTRSIIFEVFTEMNDERDALDEIMRISVSPQKKIKQLLAEKINNSPLKKLL